MCCCITFFNTEINYLMEDTVNQPTACWFEVHISEDRGERSSSQLYYRGVVLPLWRSSVIAGFLDENYRYKSICIQIPRVIGRHISFTLTEISSLIENRIYAASHSTRSMHHTLYCTASGPGYFHFLTFLFLISKN